MIVETIDEISDYFEAQEVNYIDIIDNSIDNYSSLADSLCDNEYYISPWGTLSLNGMDVITIEGRSIINPKLVIRIVLSVV